MSLQELVKADDVLTAANRKLRIVVAVRPQNEAEQKDLFLRGRATQPRFHYRSPPSFDISDVQRLRIPTDSYWGEQLSTARRLLLKLHAVLSAGKDLDVRGFSREVYGSPTEQLQAIARRILGRLKFEPGPEVSFETTRRVLEETLLKYGLTGWRVKAAPGDFTAARSSEKTVYLTPVGALYEGTAQRLAVHEIGVHAVRSFNGTAQPLSFFGFGWPGYESTEEGLAAYAELHTGLLSPQAMINYAARVLAVGALDRGKSFRDCYESLLELDLSETQAWEATLRAYRGNGLFKDHVYLQGLLEVFQFVTSGGNWKALFVGKIGLHHLPQVQHELSRANLVDPTVLPGFLQEPHASSPMWNLVRELTGRCTTY